MLPVVVPSAGMTAPVARVLEYSLRKAHPLTRVWRWAAYTLTAVPVAAVASVYAVYAVEWFVNGERPIPPHHGPDNLVEEAFYWLSGALLIAFFISAAGVAVLPVVALTMGLSRSTLVLFLPVAAWLASFVLLAVDPIGAMDFWID